jgi:hypothetical protein
MKTFYTYLLITLALFVALSCEEEKIDTEKPAISFSDLSSEQYVVGTVNLVGTATDNSQVKTVQVFIDGTLLKEISGGLINIEWDTESVEDGIHTVEIHAIDDSNNESVTSSEMRVLNNYLTFSVSPHCVGPDDEMWIFVSRSDGSVTSIQKVENGVDIKLKTPANFDIDEKLTVHRFINRKVPGYYEDNSISSYPDIVAGKYTLWDERFAMPKETKYIHHVAIFGVSHLDRLDASGDNIQQGGVEESHDNVVFSAILMTAESAADALIALRINRTESPRFLSLKDLKSGDTTKVHILEFGVMDSKELSEGPLLQLSAAVAAIPTPGDYDNIYRTWVDYWEDTDTPVNYYYVKDKYPEYIFSAYHYGETGWNEQRVISKTPPEKFTQLDGEVTNLSFAGKKLNVTTTGSHDFFVAGGGYYRPSSNLYNWWSVYSSSSDLKIILPNIPSVLNDTYKVPSTSSFSFGGVNFIDYSGVEDYSDFINFRFKSNDRIESMFKQHNSKVILVNPSSGRINVKEMRNNRSLHSSPFKRQTF